MISAVVLTKNEEKNIKDCLKTLKWCDELIVVDDNSMDKTVEIAKKMGVQVYTHNLNFDFSKQRNYGLSKARRDWVLFVDADERVSDALRYEIQYTLSSQNLLEQKMCGFYVRRIDFMWGKKLRYGETGNIRIMRLAKKSTGEWIRKVHEDWRIEGKIGQLNNPLYHYPHPSVTEFLREVNFYTDIRANELYEKKVKAYWWEIILYARIKFFVNYFLKKGFLDGVPGLIYALMMSFHSFLVRGKLWILWHR